MFNNKKNWIHGDRSTESGCKRWDSVRIDCRGTQRSFWGDENILCIVLSDGYMDVYSSQNALNWMLRSVDFMLE